MLLFFNPQALPSTSLLFSFLCPFPHSPLSPTRPELRCLTMGHQATANDFGQNTMLSSADNHSNPPRHHIPKPSLGTDNTFLHGDYRGQPLPIPAHRASLWQLLQPLAQKKTLFIRFPRTRVGADSSKPALRRLLHFMDYCFRNFLS